MIPTPPIFLNFFHAVYIFKEVSVIFKKLSVGFHTMEFIVSHFHAKKRSFKLKV